LFIGEHFSAATEPYPSPLMFAASLLSRTERLVFGTGVINAPLHHPAMIAAEAAQFDHLSKGRFILGIGSGSTPTDNELMNVPHDARERGRMLVESIEMIERSSCTRATFTRQRSVSMCATKGSRRCSRTVPRWARAWIEFLMMPASLSRFCFSTGSSLLHSRRAWAGSVTERLRVRSSGRLPI
jgi:hypothetical protein